MRNNKNRLRPSAPEHKPRRSSMPVTRASMKEWLERPEWEYLLDLLAETAEEASAAVLGADPSGAAAVARAQAEVRYLRHFTDGDIAEAMTNEIKEQKR